MRMILGLAAFALVGCGKDSKSERCDKAYAEMMKLAAEMAKALGADDSEMDKPTAEDKQKFMAMCSKLSDEALACVTDMKKATTPKCAEILAKAEADAVAGQPAAALAFESRVIDHKRATAQVPKGWEHEDFMGDTFTPPDGSNLGRGTSYRVGSACGGTCEALPAADWAKRFEDNEVANLKSEQPEILKDEAVGDAGRLLVAKTKTGRPMTKLVLGLWSDGGEIYFTCHAELDGAAAGNLADFETACRAMKVDSFSSSYSD